MLIRCVPVIVALEETTAVEWMFVGVRGDAAMEGVLVDVDDGIAGRKHQCGGCWPWMCRAYMFQRSVFHLGRYRGIVLHQVELGVT